MKGEVEDLRLQRWMMAWAAWMGWEMGGGGGRVMRMKEEEGGGAGFGRGSDGADKQLRRRRRADASMDQSDPGLPQPWPAHCSQGTEGRHLRGWTLECGSYTSCFGTCSNSVARPRSSPANHDKSCLGVLSGLPPPNLEPEGRFILSSVGGGGDDESWRRRGGPFATGTPCLEVRMLRVVAGSPRLR